MTKNYLTTRMTSKRVKNAKKLTHKSTQWLQRQINDPYVQQAQQDGYRARSAYKLLQIDDRYDILKNRHAIIDLGCAPGSWLQIAQMRCRKNADVIGVDLLEIEPMSDIDFIQGDLCAQETIDKILHSLNHKKADLVMSDMSPNTIGHRKSDHLRQMGLAENAFALAQEILLTDGVFLCKLFSGGTGAEFGKLLKNNFKQIHHFKPPASRSESPEIYVIAKGFKGNT